ncbi:hypothetical protein IFR05_006795 [Cadophora sp. M221]|nr:hypothetical protein IFR05_006795 [Cadophora sp. M221]
MSSFSFQNVRAIVVDFPWNSPILAFGVLAICLLAATNLITRISYKVISSSRDRVKTPPTVPYTIPFIGHAVGFGLDPASFFMRLNIWLRHQQTFCLKVMGTDIYFVNGRKNLSQIWKYRGASITSPGVPAFFIDRVFGMAKYAVKAYELDDSGTNALPDLRSNVAPHNRLDHLTHVGFAKLLSGDGLAGLYGRWAEDFATRLQNLNIGEDWVEDADIMEYWAHPLVSALNKALAGPLLEVIDQDFTRDFLKFLPYVPPLMKGFPRWWIPEGYRLRTRLTKTVQQWQRIARACFKESDIDGDGDSDPWWGCKAVRERQAFLGRVDNWDHDAVASSDFGLIWGANQNVHWAAVWTVVEVFKDESLLARVREELQDANFGSNFDIDKLLSLPLLNSIYAEVMRLRVEVQHVLYSKHEDIRINEWRFPKQRIVIVPAGPAHLDEDFWNSRDGKYPVDTFWADRFLVYPKDPFSGPSKKNLTSVDVGDDRGRPKYKESGIASSFIPYGYVDNCPLVEEIRLLNYMY